MVGQERTGRIECTFALVEYGGEALKDVGDLGGDLKLHGDVVVGGAGGQPGGVIEQDLV